MDLLFSHFRKMIFNGFDIEWFVSLEQHSLMAKLCYLKRKKSIFSIQLRHKTTKTAIATAQKICLGFIVCHLFSSFRNCCFHKQELPVAKGIQIADTPYLKEHVWDFLQYKIHWGKGRGVDKNNLY